jgi:1-acyl-sn-glycerol-3-phosphate acyltransferase
MPRVRPAESELTGWWRLGLGVVGPPFRLFFRLEVRGAANIPGAGPAILASNHRSVIDGVLLALVGARRRRATRFLVAAELFDLRFPGWALRTFRQIPIRRQGQDTGALDDAVAALREGSLAGIFPEGRVNDGPGMLRGHSGVGRIALAAGAPVIPAGLWGTQARWPRSGVRFGLPLRPRVVVEIGAPVHPSGRSGQASSQDDVRTFTDEVMRAIQASAAQARANAERERPRRRSLSRSLRGRRRWR